MIARGGDTFGQRRKSFAIYFVPVSDLLFPKWVGLRCQRPGHAVPLGSGFAECRTFDDGFAEIDRIVGQLTA